MHKGLAVRNSMLAVVGLALAFALALGAGSAQAKTVACGQTITSSTTLGTNVGPCPGAGIIIGADNITLDLNGHSVTGPGTSCICVGIDVDGHNKVTIVGGNTGLVQNFGAGQLLDGNNNIVKSVSTRNVTTGIRITGDGNKVLASTQRDASFFGIAVDGGNNTTIDGDAVRNTGSNGFEFDNGSGNTLIRSTAANTGGVAIDFFNQSNATVTQNQTTGNLSSTGFFLGGLSGSSTVTSNRATGHANGFDISGGGGTTVRGNAAYDNVVGFHEEGTSNQFTGNTAQGNDYGFLIVAGGATLLDQNLVGRPNGTGRGAGGNQYGIFLQDSNGVVVRRNDASSNLAAGITVDSGSANTLLDRNVTHFNGFDGIDSQSTTSTFTGNFASYNGQIGLHAVAGDLDGGGNHAFGNGNAQCTGGLSC
jgi:parallel beta-helix repeat protein